MSLAGRVSATLLVVLLSACAASHHIARGNMADVARKLTCGVAYHFPGLSWRDGSGQFHGFDVDLCRAIATVYYGSPQRIRYVKIDTLQQFLSRPDVNIVFHALTPLPSRIADRRIRFGPVIFQDGQVVATRRHAAPPLTICVAAGPPADVLVNQFAHSKRHIRILVRNSPKSAASAFKHGECNSYSADATFVVASMANSRRDITILPGRLTREPLAPIAHADNVKALRTLSTIVSLLLFAEQSGITSEDALLPDVCKRLTDFAKNGAWPGPVARRPCKVIAICGNYSELFSRYFGKQSGWLLDRRTYGIAPLRS